MRWHAPIWTALFVAACGGSVAEPDDTRPEPGVESSGGAGPRTDTPFKDTPLGPCAEGFDPDEAPNDPCDWLGEDGLCYATKEAACDCVCPRDRDSTCSSGFFRGEGQATPVDCG